MFCKGSTQSVVDTHGKPAELPAGHPPVNPDEAAKTAPGPWQPLPQTTYLDGGGMPQIAVLQPNKAHVAFIIMRMKPGFNEAKLRDAISFIPVKWTSDHPNHPANRPAGLLQIVDETSSLNGIDSMYLAVGFSTELWTQLQKGENLPKYLHSFTPKKSELPHVKTVFPATGGDILLHFKANTQQMIQDVLNQFHPLIDSEVASWENNFAEAHKDFRNPFGFYDAGIDPAKTGNPTQDYGPMFNGMVDMGRIARACIGKEDPFNQHGSYGFTCDFELNVNGFEAMKVEDQEKVFGRHKKSSALLLDPPKMPVELPNAHITRMFLPQQPHTKEFTTPLNIYRQAGGYKNDQRQGLYFMAQCRATDVFDRLIDSMLGNVDGNADTLLEWSKPLSGAYWYMPSQQQMINLTPQIYEPQNFK